MAESHLHVSAERPRRAQVAVHPQTAGVPPSGLRRAGNRVGKPETLHGRRHRLRIPVGPHARHELPAAPLQRDGVEAPSETGHRRQRNDADLPEHPRPRRPETDTAAAAPNGLDVGPHHRHWWKQGQHLHLLQGRQHLLQQETGAGSEDVKHFEI